MTEPPDEPEGFMMDVAFTIQWRGDEMPDEETILAPMKRFIKTTVKAYSKVAKIVNMKTNIYEVGFEGEESPDNT